MDPEHILSPFYLLSLTGCLLLEIAGCKALFSGLLKGQGNHTAHVRTCQYMPSSSAVLSHLWKMISAPQNYHLKFRFCFTLGLEGKKTKTLLCHQRQACARTPRQTHTLFAEILFLLMWKQCMSKESTKHRGCCAPSAGSPWGKAASLHHAL